MKWLVGFLVGMLALSAADRPPVPGVPKGAPQSETNAALSQCKVPPWLAILPPDMEPDYRDCVNNVFRPTDMKALTVLKQQIGKSAELVAIDEVPQFFSRVYRVRYTLDGKERAMICNDKMTYCVPDAPVVGEPAGKE